MLFTRGLFLNTFNPWDKVHVDWSTLLRGMQFPDQKSHLDSRALMLPLTKDRAFALWNLAIWIVVTPLWLVVAPGRRGSQRAARRLHGRRGGRRRRRRGRRRRRRPWCWLWFACARAEPHVILVGPSSAMTSPGERTSAESREQQAAASGAASRGRWWVASSHQCPRADSRKEGKFLIFTLAL